MRRFFEDKSWSVGGPIPLNLLYRSTSLSLVRDTPSSVGLRLAGESFGDHEAGVLAKQMEERDIDEAYHGGLALLYLRLCRSRAALCEQTGLAS